MFRLVRIPMRLVWPVLAILTMVFFTASARAQEEKKVEKNSGALRLNLRLVPAAPAVKAQESAAASETDKNAGKPETAEEVQKAVVAAQKKMAEAKALFNEAQAKMEEAQAKMEQARRDLLEASKKSGAAGPVGRSGIRRAPLVMLRAGTATTSNRAVEDVRKAYEEKKRAEQERLHNDPKWQPSHEPGAVIKFSDNPKSPVVNSFCLNGEGNLLVCCGGVRYAYDAAGRQSGRPPKEIGDPAEVRVVSPAGNQLGVWKLQSEPQAICVGDGGTVFVGGAGKLIKLDKNGKVLATADAPNAIELPPPAEPEKNVESEAAKKAREEKIAEMQKQANELREAYLKIAQEARKDLKPGDEESMKAYRAKLQEPKYQEMQQKYLAASRELSAARLTPEMKAYQARQAWLRKMTITSIAVSGNDLFLACPMTKATGYAVWRTDLDFGNPKRIVEGLAGCCSQMDVKAKDGEIWIAHNSRHKVDHFDREGKKLSSFGKTDRINPDGFGGCCEPKNLRFGAEGELFACESGPPTCVKRFSTDGEFKGVVAIAPWTSGCVRVTTEVSADGSKFFVLHSDENSIQVFTKKKAEAAEKQAETAEQSAKN
ncbi:MAG: hypothetical protein IT426_05075 [Pirellulales bacterium]|nr:hypothetical protein [Pirellulales bacterium]